MLTWLQPPTPAPRDLVDKLVVAWVAYEAAQAEEEGAKAHCHLSQQRLQQLVRFGARSAAEKCLNRLRRSSGHGPWLSLSRSSAGAKGNHYRLGPAAQPYAEEWTAVGRVLFGPAGVMRPYMSRPVLLHQGVRLHGAMVLAYVERFGPVSVAEIKAALKGFLDRTTVEKHLNYLTTEELLLVDGGLYYAPMDLRERVQDFEKDVGLAERANEIDRLMGERSLQYQLQLAGGPEIATIKQLTRKLACYYCGVPAPPKGGDVEHFPPLHWGGTDQLSLLLPVCRGCNARHGLLIGRTPAQPTPVRDEPLPFLSSGDPQDLLAHAQRVRLFDAFTYADALNRGDVTEAMRIALSSFEIMVALRTPGLAIVVDPETGEVSPVQLGHVVDGRLIEDFTGIAGLLDPAPVEGKGPRRRPQR